MPFVTFMAALSQLLSHFPHLMHPPLHVLRIIALFSLRLEQRATAPLRFTGTLNSMCIGHVFTQTPHPVHLCVSTCGRPFFPMERAPNWQTFTQSPKPTHPHWHIFVPLTAWWAAAQFFTP